MLRMYGCVRIDEGCACALRVRLGFVCCAPVFLRGVREVKDSDILDDRKRSAVTRRWIRGEEEGFYVEGRREEGREGGRGGGEERGGGGGAENAAWQWVSRISRSNNPSPLPPPSSSSSSPPPLLLLHPPFSSVRPSSKSCDLQHIKQGLFVFCDPLVIKHRVLVLFLLCGFRARFR